MKKIINRHQLTSFHLWIPFSIIILIVSYFMPEGGSIYSFLFPRMVQPECMMRKLTGLSCGTCGMTRAFAAIGKGKFETALLEHPLAIPLFFLFLFLGALATFDLLGLKNISKYWISLYSSHNRQIFLVIFTTFLMVYISRMIGELQCGYYKPHGFEKLFFIWFFIFK